MQGCLHLLCRVATEGLKVAAEGCECGPLEKTDEGFAERAA